MPEPGTGRSYGDPLADAETYGRSVVDERTANRAANGNLPARHFMDAVGVSEVSGERLDDPPGGDAVARGVRLAAGRVQATGRPHEFFGWATLRVSDVRKVRCDVLFTPSSDNPEHSDLVYPSAAMVSRDRQKEYATLLVAESGWLPKPQLRVSPVEQ